jgi:hypothetical protein
MLLVSVVSMILVVAGGLSKAWFNNLDNSVFVAPYWFDGGQTCYGCECNLLAC